MFWLKFQAQSLGAIYLIATDSALLQISINSTPGCIACGEAEPAPSGHPVLRHSRQQLQEYCRGRLRQLQLPFGLCGTTIFASGFAGSDPNTARYNSYLRGTGCKSGATKSRTGNRADYAFEPAADTYSLSSCCGQESATGRVCGWC